MSQARAEVQFGPAAALRQPSGGGHQPFLLAGRPKLHGHHMEGQWKVNGFHNFFLIPKDRKVNLHWLNMF
jgi:hypothetical protein